MPSIAEIQAKKAAKEASRGGSQTHTPDAARSATPAARRPTTPVEPGPPTAAPPRLDPGAITEARTAAKLNELAPNPLNPRTKIDPDSPKMLELRQSLRERGQLHPVPVVTAAHFRLIFGDTPHAAQIGNAAFVIIGGGRRYAAATAEHLLSLKINVMHGDRAPQTPADWMALTLAENVHQDSLTVMQTARGVAEMRRYSSGRSVAQTLSKSPGWVTQYLQLVDLPADVQDVIDSAPFSLRQARRVYDQPTPNAQLYEAQAICARLLKTELPETPTTPEPQPPPTPTAKTTGRPSFTPAQKLGSRLVKVDRDTVLEALLLRFPAADRSALANLLVDPPPADDTITQPDPGV